MRAILKDSIFLETLWAISGNGVRLAFQIATFAIIARELGPEPFGMVAAVGALTAAISPFANLGTGNLVIRDVTRDPGAYRESWGYALWTTFFFGCVLSLVVIAFSGVLLPSTIPMYVLLGMLPTEMIIARMNDLNVQCLQGRQMLRPAVVAQTTFSVVRFFGACLLFVIPGAGVGHWVLISSVSSFIALCFSTYLGVQAGGRPRLHAFFDGQRLKDGAGFALSLSSMAAMNDIDKTVLARLGTLGATGIYSTAYRILDTAFLPVRSLLFATYARFFKEGHGGLQSSKAWSMKFVPFSVGYGAVTAVGLYVAAPLLPLIFGQAFAESILVLRWLCILPLFKGIHYFAADTLTGAGYQPVRAAVYVGMALMNVALNVWLVPLYSWKGAAVASLATDGLLGVVLWSIVFVLGRKR